MSVGFSIQNIVDPSINVIKCDNSCTCRNLQIEWGGANVKTMFVFPNLATLKAFVGLLNIVVGEDEGD